MLRRHVDQLRIRYPCDQPTPVSEEVVDDYWLPLRSNLTVDNTPSPATASPVVTFQPPATQTPAVDPVSLCRSLRDRRPVQRYTPSLQT